MKSLSVLLFGLLCNVDLEASGHIPKLEPPIYSRCLLASSNNVPQNFITRKNSNCVNLLTKPIPFWVHRLGFTRTNVFLFLNIGFLVIHRWRLFCTTCQERYCGYGQQGPAYKWLSILHHITARSLDGHQICCFRVSNVLFHIQLFWERLLHKSVKAYTTMPISIMGTKSLALIDWLKFMSFTNQKRENINTLVCAVPLYVAKTPKTSIKDHEPHYL